MLDPPSFGVFNEDQTKCMIISTNDILYIDLNRRCEIDGTGEFKMGYELDIDEQESIGDILNILADEKYFYVLANKKHGILGYYLLMIEIDHPEREATYLINWTNKFNIRQVGLNFMEDENDEKELQKYLVVSYKVEGINTYNVFVIDVKTHLIRFWFESYQLYESPIKGFLLSTNDFMMLSKDGINVINVGS